MAIARARAKLWSRNRAAFALASLLAHIAIVAAIIETVHPRLATEPPDVIPVMIRPLTAPRTPPKEEKAKPPSQRARGTTPERSIAAAPSQTPVSALWSSVCQGLDAETRKRLGLPDCNPERANVDQATKDAIAAAQAKALATLANREGWLSEHDGLAYRSQWREFDVCVSSIAICGVRAPALASSLGDATPAERWSNLTAKAKP
jgi:hypothetical protein